MLCEYKDILGKVGKGIHSYRLFNIAIADVMATILLAYGFHKLFHTNFLITLFFLFILGIISHRLFCVRSTIDQWLFP